MTACSGSERPSEPPGPETAVARAEVPAVDPLEAAIAEHWRAAGVEPVGEVDDLGFLRRASLDLVGRIPTALELERFAADERPDRRAAVVDALLASDEFVEHWSELYTDTLLHGAGEPKPRVRQAMHDWLWTQLYDEAGWDEIVADMITAQWSEGDDGGAAAFLVAHGRGNQVEALTGQTARAFLGLQVQCAQCHDDPDDRFTQREFYGLAAYYARTRARIATVDGIRVPRIVDRRRGEMRMPTEYDAPGDRSGERVPPGFPGLHAVPREDETRRDALARGVVRSELLAKAAVNHVWARLLGRGIVEPWDDLGAPVGAEHPPLLTWLADDFVAHDHDLRYLLRRVVLSPAYQRSAEGPAQGATARQQAFAQAAVRPLPASPLLRSLLVATGLHDVEGRAFAREVERRRRALRRDYEQAFEDDEGAAADAFSGNVPQALLLLNGELTNQGLGASAGALAQLLRTEPEPGARIDALTRRVYGRPASPQQRQALLAFLDEREHDPAAYEDAMHAMLLTSEFLTNH